MAEYQIRAGQKYWRTIHSLPKADGTHDSIMIDVYCVTKAYPTGCAARDHAIKKLLCAGSRNKGDELQDLLEAGEALQRSIDEVRRQYAEEKKNAGCEGASGPDGPSEGDFKSGGEVYYETAPSKVAPSRSWRVSDAQEACDKLSTSKG